VEFEVLKAVIMKNIIIIFYYWCGNLGTAATTVVLLYQPRMIGEGDCGEICGMKIGRGSRSTLRNPASLFPPQMPRD
jgi:hypothetical protein